jgi:predicted exporter
VRPFRVSLGADVGLLALLSDVRDPDALERRLAGVPCARLLDMGTVLTRIYGAYRARMAGFLLLGMAAVVALVAARHRALRPTLVACTPAVLAALGTVSALAYLGIELNLLSLVALLMVVSMGDDFGIFLAEAGDDAAALRATNLAVLVAGLTTILGFGLLALSDDPALDSIGVTAGIGTALCMLFALAVGALFPAAPRPSAPRAG